MPGGRCNAARVRWLPRRSTTATACERRSPSGWCSPRLTVWGAPLEEEVVARSLDYHRRFYAMVGATLDDIAADHPRFVLLDVHSYNHRRDGPDGPPTPPET